MYPEIILHNAMSLDGRITNFPADLELFYTLATTWNPDAILFGSSTILEAPSLDVPPEHAELFRPPPGTTSDPRPLMVVVDSKGKIRCWDILKKWPYFRGFVVICSEDTPLEYREYLAKESVDMIVSGSEKVDLKSALGQLHAAFGIRVVRADSGGTLNSALLKSGLVKEISVLIHPCLTGGSPEPTIFDPRKAGFFGFPVPLNLSACQTMKNGILWLRYTPVKSDGVTQKTASL